METPYEGWSRLWGGGACNAHSHAIKAILIVAVAVLAGYVLYDFNGGSFDLRDRSVLLIVTDSMDGDVHGYDVDSFPKDTFVMIHELDRDDVENTIEVGDVISFRQGPVLNHHRVVETHFDEGYVVTKGDNAPLSENVKTENIEGVVVGTNHVLGWFAAFAKDHVYAVLAVLFVVFSVEYARGVIRRDKERKENEDNEHDN